ncbi:MAG TPA: cupin domain-containing protein [Caldilineae bacterium]|nr:cupin domain-containing protein [Caldilineae bacterium]
MAAPDIVRWAEVEPVEVAPGMWRRTLGTGERGMLIEVRAEPGVQLEAHSHPAEQIGYVVSGEVELTIDGTPYRFSQGDSYAIPGNVPHSARFLTSCVLAEYFTPVREEYRRK